MTCISAFFWSVVWTQSNWVETKTFTENEIDKKLALQFIQNEMLPRLESAGNVPMPAGTAPAARDILTELVRVIQSWFRIPMSEHRVAWAEDNDSRYGSSRSAAPDVPDIPTPADATSICDEIKKCMCI